MDLARISTGIAGLDTLLHGGFIKGRSYLVTGDTGTGKTIACLQFLVSSLALGEKAVYVTADERPADLLASAASFSWDLQPHIQAKSLVILDAAGGSAIEKGVDPQKMVSDLGNYAKSLGATILILDPITPLLLPTQSTTSAQAHIRSLIQLIQSHLNTTNLFTSHDSRSGGHEPAVGTEQFLASGVLALKTREADVLRERVIQIRKMRYTPVEPGDYPFALVQNQGIVLVDRPSANGVSRHAEPHFFKSFEPDKKDF